MKKIIPYFIFFFIGGEFLKAQQNESLAELEGRTSRLITQALPTLKEDWRTLEADTLRGLAQDIQQISYGINRLISAKKSPDWASPSPDRVREIDKWGEMIQPYNEVLVDVVLESDKSEGVRQLALNSRKLIDYTSPDNVLTARLQQEIEDGGNLSRATKAVEILHEHRVLEEEDLAKLPKISSHLSKEKQMKWLANLAEFGVKINSGTILEYLEGIVFDSKHEDQHVSKLMPVFNAMRNSGGDAVLFRERLSEIKETFDVIAPGYSGNIQSVITWIDEGARPERKIAKNGSGYLDEPVFEVTVEDNSLRESYLEKQTTTSIDRERPTVQNSEKQYSNKRPLYLVLFVLILSGIGVLVWNGRKGSSAS